MKSCRMSWQTEVPNLFIGLMLILVPFKFWTYVLFLSWTYAKHDCTDCMLNLSPTTNFSALSHPSAKLSSANLSQDMNLSWNSATVMSSAPKPATLISSGFEQWKKKTKPRTYPGTPGNWPTIRAYLVDIWNEIIFSISCSSSAQL